MKRFFQQQLMISLVGQFEEIKLAVRAGLEPWATRLQAQQCNLLVDAAYQTYSPLSILCFGTRVIKCDIDCFAQSSLHQPGGLIKEPAEFSRVQYVLLLFFTELNNWN